MTLHPLDTIERLECANQNTARSSFRFAGNVKHEMRAVVEKYVRVAGRLIHRANTWGRPAKMMPGRIAWRIRFGFDNSATESAARQVMDDDLADKKTRQLDCVLRQFCSLELTNLELRFRALQLADFGFRVL